METLRFADAVTAAAYPLPVGGFARWQAACCDGGPADPDGARWELPLQRIPAGCILTPSFACLPADGASYIWRLSSSAGTWSLQPVPSRPRNPKPRSGSPARTADAPVTTHIDCFHIHKALPDARLELHLRASPPPRYLLTVSLRAVDLPRVGVPDRAARLAQPPPAITQMTANPTLARRICSPTCVAMVMAHWERAQHAPHQDGTEDGLRDAMVRACHDPATGMYGVWPLALRAAAGRGRLGAVELFADWQEPLAVLAAGIPLVTSIRFGEGQLAGAPLTQSGGHLVVLHEAAPEHVCVNDPAGADRDAVARSYAAEAFSRAWLSHRGAAYILLP